MQDKIEYPMFSRKEMDRRYNKARTLMAERKIDCLLITGEENFHYFTGTCASIAIHNSVARPSVVLLPLERDPIILTQNLDAIKLSTYISDIRPFSDVLHFPHTVIVDALKDVRWKYNRMGAELGQEQRMGIPVQAYLELIQALPKVEFVDAAQVFIKLRMVKSPEEIAYIKQACAVTARARQKMYAGDYIRPGTTERDVARIIGRLMMEEGADRVSFVHLQQDIPGCKNQFHYDRPLKKGTILQVDAGAYVQMYTVDYVRMAALGKATPAQREVCKRVSDISDVMAKTLRPGITAADLHRTCVQAIEKAGVDPVHPKKITGGDRFGHGQGMLITEPPSVNPRDMTMLEPGVVISTEPSIRMGSEAAQWEDVHVITENGAEQLTTETDELRELAW